MPQGRDAAHAHGGVEHQVVLRLQARGIHHVALVCDVLDDLATRFLVIAQVLQGSRNGLVDDLHGTPADQLLELDQTEVGLDAGGVAVHHEADGAGGRQHRGLSVAEAVLASQFEDLVPLLGGRLLHGTVDTVGGAQRIVCCLVLAHHPLVCRGIEGEFVVRTHHAGQLRRTAVGGACHQRSDGAGQRPPGIGVVSLAQSHQQCTQIGVTDAQLTEGARVLGNGVSREIREANRDVHGGDDQFHSASEPLCVESVVVAEELEQVEAGQVA